jgi:hypothetical protein
MNNMMLAQLLQDMQVRRRQQTFILDEAPQPQLKFFVAAMACGAAGRRDAYRADGYGYGGRGDNDTEGIVMDSCVLGSFDMYLL